MSLPSNASSLTCSVIIPTFNNEAVIADTLTALWAQPLPAAWQCQCLIADDGSTDATLARIRHLPPPPAWSVTTLTNPHRGAAHARNQGLAAASGAIIFFLGADILLRPGALAAHLRFHQTRPSPNDAALGFVAWDPRLRPTPLMEWMMHGGPQNDYDALLGARTADPRHFWYGSHLSLKRAALAHDRFATAFQQYGWEDLELGRRLHQRGLTLTPLPAALGLHRHVYTAADISRRQRLVGRSLVIYQAKHPAAVLIPPRTPARRWRHRASRWLGLAELAALLLRLGSRRSLPRVYALATAAAFWVGVEDGLRLSPPVE